MKKKLLLVLLPALALGITGCKSADKGSESSAGSEQSSESSSGGGEHNPEILPEECGTAEAPLTIAQAKALFDKADPTKSGSVFTTYPVYVEGACYDNAAKNSSGGDHNFAKIADSSNNFISIQYYVTDSALGSTYDAKGSMVSKKVVASGYAQIYKKGNDYIYELVKKDSDTKPVVLAVSDLAMPTGVNYGSVGSPLSVSEATAEIDKFPAKVTDAAMYVTGTVKSNEKADTGYGNLSMVIEDADHHEFTLYRVNQLPGFTTDELKAIQANDLVGASVVASSVCKYYFDSAIYETEQAPTISTFDFDPGQITSLAFGAESYDIKQGQSMDLSAKLSKNPSMGSGTIEFSINEGVVTGVTLDTSTGVIAIGESTATQKIHVTARLVEDESVSASVEINIMEKAAGTEATAEFTLSSTASVTVDGVTVTFAQGSGSSAPAWYAAGLRLYANNTVTITSESSIVAMEFNWEKQGSKAFASATANVGDYSHPSAAGKGTWSGEENTIVITLGGSGQLQLNTFTVTYIE